jgi:hypothetical protein
MQHPVTWHRLYAAPSHLVIVVSQELASFINALAKLDHHPGELVLDKFVRCAQHKLPQFNLQVAGRTYHTYGSDGSPCVTVKPAWKRPVALVTRACWLNLSRRLIVQRDYSPD